MTEGPERVFRRGLVAVENGAIGVTGCEAGRSGILAVASLISGGVTRFGFCSGLTGIGAWRVVVLCAASCFAWACGFMLAARLSDARNDSVGG